MFFKTFSAWKSKNTHWLAKCTEALKPFSQTLAFSFRKQLWQSAPGDETVRHSLSHHNLMYLLWNFLLEGDTNDCVYMDSSNSFMSLISFLIIWGCGVYIHTHRNLDIPTYIINIHTPVSELCIFFGTGAFDVYFLHHNPPQFWNLRKKWDNCSLLWARY